MLNLSHYVDSLNGPAANDAQSFDPRTAIVKVGQRLRHAGHFARGMGTVVAIIGEQNTRSTRDLGGVLVGGSASFDLVFDDGSRSLRVPESIVRRAPYTLLPQVFSADEVTQAKVHADAVEAAAQKAKADRAAAFTAECERLRNCPEYANYERGSDKATAASNIRRELKGKFPGVKFSVTQRRGGSSITVRWTGGPRKNEVDAVLAKFAVGHFDGMTDSYSYNRSPWCEVFGGSEYIFCERDEPRSE